MITATAHYALCRNKEIRSVKFCTYFQRPAKRQTTSVFLYRYTEHITLKEGIKMTTDLNIRSCQCLSDLTYAS